ncbi:MAG: DUF192 domain-containing protein [Chloroflexota bacterium]
MLSIKNETRGTSLASRCRVASSMGDRIVGLLSVDHLEAGTGLLIERTQSIHMFFMRFAIDAVFVEKTGRVTKVVADLRPWRVVWWARGARDCIELPVGAIAASGTQVGDQLVFQPLA